MGSSALQYVMMDMAGKWQVILGVMILSIAMLPLDAAAYNSGGIEASEAQVNLSPPTGLSEGDSMTISLILSNTHFTKIIIQVMNN